MTLHKVILIILLAVVSNSAMAEWEKAMTKEIATIYFDNATILKTRNLVKMWRLVDFKKASLSVYEEPFMSLTVLHEYDCAKQLYRRLDLIYFSENMARGKERHGIPESVTDQPSGILWAPVQTNDVSELLWETACGKWLPPQLDIPADKKHEVKMKPYAYTGGVSLVKRHAG